MAVYPPIPFGPIEQDIVAKFQPPGFRKDATSVKESNDTFIHLLGTDNTGRDVLTQMIYGTRISLTVGFVAVGLYITIGVIVGAIAGYFGGKIDMLISRVIRDRDAISGLFLDPDTGRVGRPEYLYHHGHYRPDKLGVCRPIDTWRGSWATFDRLCRGRAGRWGRVTVELFSAHILPNAISPALVTIPFGVAGAIITEAGLSLLGFGVRPPTPSWGTLLRLGSENYEYWWLVVIPSVAMFVTVTVFNLVGSGTARRDGPTASNVKKLRTIIQYDKTAHNNRKPTDPFFHRRRYGQGGRGCLTDDSPRRDTRRGRRKWLWQNL